jgi:heme exporter protein B
MTVTNMPATVAPATGALSGATWAIARDLKLALRSKAELGVALLFYVIIVTLFPLGVGADPAVLRNIGPGVLWVAALLSSLLSLPRMFASDYADGTLEQMALSGHPLQSIVFGKIAAHWLSTGMPLVAISPLLGMQYGLAGGELAILAAGLLLGTPTLSLLGAIGAALTLGLRGGGGLLALLILPLYVPILIFGAGAVDALRAGLDAAPYMSLLGAAMLGALVGAPFAAAAAVRIALD